MEPWGHWIPPDLHGFNKWVFDALGMLNDFVRQVLLHVPNGYGRICDLGPTLGLGLILFLLLPSLSSKTRWRRLPRSWLSLISLMLSSVRRGCGFSVGLGHPVVTVDQFLNFVDPFLPQKPVLELLGINGQDLFEVAKARKFRLVVWTGGPGMIFKSLPPAWFSGLAILPNMVEATAVWPW